jgi:chromosome segregation ATPase
MKSGAITYAEVVRAAIRILREGQNISKPLIRERLGNRGSHTTIQKHLDGWRESLTTSDLEVLPPSMPPELMPHIEALWSASTALVEDKLADEWARAKQAVEAAEQTRDTALLERDQWQDYAKETAAELATRDTEIVQYQNRLATTEDRLRIRDQEYQGAVDRLTEKDRAIENERQSMKERIELLESRHKQDMEAAESRWDAEREKLQEQAEAAKERADLEIKRSDSHEVYFLNEVAKARHETEATRERCERDVARLEQDLNITRRREESSSVRLGKMEERLMAAEDEATAASSEKTAAVAELARVRELLVAAEEERRQLSDRSRSEQ